MYWKHLLEDGMANPYRFLGAAGPRIFAVCARVRILTLTSRVRLSKPHVTPTL
jgi:hypothetical protein